MIINVSNNYCNACIEVFGRIIPVSKVNSDIIDEGLTFSIDDAEKLALILEDHRVQFSPYKGSLRTLYGVYHIDSNKVRLMKVLRFSYELEMSAREVLEISTRQHLF